MPLMRAPRASTVMKLSISARDEERCDGVVERPVDDSVHGRLETSEYSTSLVHDG